MLRYVGVAVEIRAAGETTSSEGGARTYSPNA